MIITKQHKSFLIVAGVGAVAVFFASRYVASKAKQGAQAVGQAINPINNDNIFAAGVNAVGEKITGDEHFTLGGFIYEAINGDT